MVSRNRILVTGAAGFVGSTLTEYLSVKGSGGNLVATDLHPSENLEGMDSGVSFISADLSNPDSCFEMISDEIDTVFHCASLISGGAERDFVNGLKANLHGTLNLLEACRIRGHCPTVVFTSSIAVFGGNDQPSTVDDWTVLHPQTSYGAAKAIGEQLFNDYSRRGFVDGRGIRLPAVVIRDEPSPSADGITGAILREPLKGRDYVCPLDPKTRIPLLGISDCVEMLDALSTLPSAAFGDYRTVNSPNLTPTVEEMVAAVNRSDCPNKGRIQFRPDTTIGKIINAWPKTMKALRAEKMGLNAPTPLDKIITNYLDRT